MPHWVMLGLLDRISTPKNRVAYIRHVSEPSRKAFESKILEPQSTEE